MEYKPDPVDLSILANAKAWLKVKVDDDDGLLQRLVTAASQYIQTWIGRRIASQSYTETRSGNGGQQLVLKNYPISAVAGVSINGVDIPPAPDVLTSGYRLINDALWLNGFIFSRGMGNVIVNYTAGFAATPPDLEQACLELVALRYKERDRIGLNSQTLAQQVTAYSTKDMSDGIKSILNRYKRVAPI